MRESQQTITAKRNPSAQAKGAPGRDKGLIPKHVSQVLCPVQQAPESHFFVFVTVENQPVVETRHKHIPGGMVRISIPPNRANVWMLRQQLDGRVHGIDKPLGSGWILVTEIESLAFNV